MNHANNDILNGGYIRVLTPQTTDGMNTMIGPDGRAVYKESHLALDALSSITDENKRRPQHLQHKIEIVHS